MSKATLVNSESLADGKVAHTIRVHTPAGPALLVVESRNRKFAVTSFEVEGHPELCLAFAGTGPGVDNLDDESDIAQCFGLSCSIRYNGMRMNAREMNAYSIEGLVAALAVVKLRTFDPEAI